MKQKNSLILFLILLILSLVAYFQFKTREKKFQSPKQETSLFSDLDSIQTNRVEIITPTKRTVLEKQDDLWLVATSGNYPADKRLVDILLRRITSLSVGEIVSENPLKHPVFRVDGTGIKAKFFGDEGTLLISLYVGKTDDDYVDTYLRREGSDQVFVIHDNIQQVFVPYEWRSHNLFHFQPEDIRQVFLTIDGGVEHIKKKEDGVWEKVSGENVLLNGHKVRTFIDTLCEGRSLDFAKEGVDIQIPSDPEFKIRVLLKDESVRTLVIGEAVNPVSFHVRILEKKPVFLVSKRWLERLQKSARRIF